MTTGFSVLKTVLMPASTSRPSLPNSGPRWSMVGFAIAAKTGRGVFVGPGICKKWRPGKWVIDRFTPEDVRNFFEILAALESGAGRLACGRITDAEIAVIERLHYDMYGHYMR